MKIDIIFGGILLLFFFVVFPTLILCFVKDKKILKIIGLSSFVLYIILLSILVFGDVSIDDKYVYVDFVSNHKWFSLNFVVASFGWKNIIRNIFMMFPISAFIKTLTDKNILTKTLLASFLISFYIELFQFVLPIDRYTELFDFVMNTFSGFVGYVYFQFIFKIREKKFEEKRGVAKK